MPRPSTGRRRGGQPGNMNRLTHGLYSRRLPREFVGLPNPRTRPDPDFEIALARVRLCQLLDQQKSAPSKDWLSFERAVLHYLGLITSLTAAAARRSLLQPDLSRALASLRVRPVSGEASDPEHSNLIQTSVGRRASTRR